jgi:hypothetical protein
MLQAATQDVDAVLAMTFPNVKFKAIAQDPERLQSLQQLRIVEYSGDNPAECAKARGTGGGTIAGDVRQGVGLGVQGVEIGVQIANAAGNAVLQAVPIVGSVVSTILGIVQGIQAHHSAAVAQEQTTLCTIVPQVNQAFASLDAGVVSGKVSVADAITSLDSVGRAYKQGVSGIIQEDPSHCNAACYIDGEVQEQIAERKRLYAGAAPPGGLQGGISNASAAITSSFTKYWWAWLMAGAIIILFRKVE